MPARCPHLPALVLLAGLACLAPAFAAVDDAPATATPDADPMRIRPIIGALVTGTVGTNRADVTNRDGSSASFDPGARWQVFAGAEFPVTESGLVVRLDVGVQQGTVDTPAGGESLRRFPLEAALLYPVAPHLRVGAGVRYAARLRFSGPGGDTSNGLNASPGLLLLADYSLGTHLSLDLRYAVETLGRPDGGSINAQHWGVGATARY